MNCPQCGSPYLKVAVVFTGDIACDFSKDEEFELLDTVALDSYWDHASPCRCLHCEWQGCIRHAQSGPGDVHPEQQVNAPRLGDADAMTAERLQEIKEALADGYCNPPWRGYLEELVVEVERLQALLTAVTRMVDRQSASGYDSSADDTVLG